MLELTYPISMQDNFGRNINSLRISVTQRCNLKCFYCHKEGQDATDGEISPPEIEKIIEISAKLGMTKLKLTGGEPLLREDVCDIIQRASNHIHDISLTTNGTLLDQYCAELKDAGLKRVNISLDTMDSQKYKMITKTDALPQAIAGIEAAVANDLTPVKLNMVVMKGINDSDIEDMIHFIADNDDIILQLIELETSDISNEIYKRYHHDFTLIEGWIRRRGLRVQERELHHRCKYFIENGGGISEVEIVRPMHNTTFCKNCTRMRVTSDGKLKPCLLRGDNLVDIIEPIRNGASDEELTEMFKKAILLREPFWA
ncbi:MAG: GTP 3',8-cyclase MoaA [Methanosarcinales archaeon Met12]|nr:MAG: GTP 3',8-cyclase MoaA [Methanosarcinales archaeon Met12]